MTDNEVPECVICLDTTLPLIQLCDRHYACGHDLEETFTRAVRFESAYPPSCCHAAPHISVEKVDLYVNDSLIAEYRRKEREYAVPRKLRVYCANSECGKFLDHDGFQGDLARYLCIQCESVTCAECRQLVRAPHVAGAPNEVPELSDTLSGVHICQGAEEDREALELARKEGYKRCPNCRVLIELRDACNHMNCSECGEDFCFVCLDHFPCDNDCPQYGEPPFNDQGYYANGFHRSTGLDREGRNRHGTVGPVDRSGPSAPSRRPRRPLAALDGLDPEMREEDFLATVVQLIEDGMDPGEANVQANRAIAEHLDDLAGDGFDQGNVQGGWGDDNGDTDTGDEDRDDQDDLDEAEWEAPEDAVEGGWGAPSPSREDGELEEDLPDTVTGADEAHENEGDQVHDAQEIAIGEQAQSNDDSELTVAPWDTLGSWDPTEQESFQHEVLPPTRTSSEEPGAPLVDVEGLQSEELEEYERRLNELWARGEHTESHGWDWVGNR